MFSLRSQFDLAPNEFTRTLARLRDSGRTFIDLTVSNPTDVKLPEEPRCLAALANPRALHYAPHPLGMLEARETVAHEAAQRGLTVSPQDIMLTASTSEAYSLLFKLLTDPGDEILVPQPSYPLFEHLARFDNVILKPYPLAYDGTWYIPREPLEQARSPRTRALIVVSPNNPTGSCLHRDELELLSDLGLPIVADEVFADYLLPEAKSRVHLALELEDVLVFSLGGLSKSLAFPQLKLAWTLVGGPERLRQAALARLELLNDAYLSVSTSVQCALPELFTHGKARRLALAERIFRNSTHLDALCHNTSVTVLRRDGGWTAVLRLPRIYSEQQWVTRLLEEAGVLVQPGWFYDFAEEAYTVLSLIIPEQDFALGLEQLIAYVRRES